MFLKTLTSLQAWCRVTLSETLLRLKPFLEAFSRFRTLPSDKQKRCRFAWNCSAGQVCWRTPRTAAVPNTPLVRRRFLRSLLLSLLLKAQRHAHTHWPETHFLPYSSVFSLCLGSPTKSKNASVCLLLRGCPHDAMRFLWFLGWFLSVL